MELKPNMYVRTKEGYIAKCTYFDSELENIYGFDNAVRRSFGDTYDFIYCDEQKEYITKASHNIIDLIEVGDYVNGCEVTSKDQFLGFGNHDWYIADYEIKSIVTKEMFESMKYKVD